MEIIHTKKTLPSQETPENSNLTMLAYQKIKKDIMQNKYKQGECISGSQIAKKLQISRTPVREAINILANEGLVESKNGVGIYIREITEKDFLELFEVRSALEAIAVEALIRKNTQENHLILKELEHDWLHLKNIFANKKHFNIDDIDVDTMITLDYKTHNYIVQNSNNNFLIELVENIEQRIKRAQYLSVTGLNDAQNTIEQHIDIIQSIINKDIETSIKLLKHHILHAVDYIFQPLK